MSGFGKLAEMSAQASFLNERYGLNTDGFPADEIAALHDLSAGGSTSGEVMRELHAAVFAQVASAREAAKAALRR